MRLTDERSTAAITGFGDVSKQDAAAYIGDLLEALETFAYSKDLRFLGRILALAIEEAGRAADR